MLAIEFPEQTHVLAKDQPQYTPLPVHINTNDESVPMTACFQLSPEELAEVNANGGKFFFTQLTFGNAFQPIRMSVSNPFIQQPVNG